MKHARRAGITPALAVASVALIFAVAGTAIAGPDAISNKIGKSKVKNIANKQITKAAPGLSVAKAVTADSAVSATNASAVNGRTPTKVFAQIPVGSADAPIATFDGFAITASCTPSGELDRLLVSPSALFTNLAGDGNGNIGPVFSYAGGSPIRLDADGTNNNSQGHASFSASSSGGSVVTGMLSFDSAPAFATGSGCAVYGEVTQGG